MIQSSSRAKNWAPSPPRTVIKRENSTGSLRPLTHRTLHAIPLPRPRTMRTLPALGAKIRQSVYLLFGPAQPLRCKQSPCHTPRTARSLVLRQAMASSSFLGMWPRAPRGHFSSTSTPFFPTRRKNAAHSWYLTRLIFSMVEINEQSPTWLLRWLHLWLHLVSAARFTKVGNRASLGVLPVGASRLELLTPCL